MKFIAQTIVYFKLYELISRVISLIKPENSNVSSKHSALQPYSFSWHRDVDTYVHAHDM